MSEGNSALTPKTRLGKRQYYEPPQRATRDFHIPQPTEGVSQSYNIFGARRPKGTERDRLVIGDSAWQEKLKADLRTIATRAGFKVIEVTIHKYPVITESDGYTAAITVGESAIVIHTWPEKPGRTIQVDVSVCSGSKDHRGQVQDNSRKTPGLIRLLAAHFEARSFIRTKKQRLPLDEPRNALPIERLSEN